MLLSIRHMLQIHPPAEEPSGTAGPRPTQSHDPGYRSVDERSDWLLVNEAVHVECYGGFVKIKCVVLVLR